LLAVSYRYVVQLIPQDSAIADDEIVGCWTTPEAAGEWRDRYERTHPFISGLVKDLWSPREPPAFPNNGSG
jgi:hypothetical protein